MVETISAGLDLDRILQGVAQLVTETTETDVCFVHLLDERGRKLQLRGATPPFDTMVGSIELALGEGVAGWVADHGQPAVIVDNKAADPRYRYIPALRGEEFTSMLSVPVVTPMGHLVGVLNVHTRLRREFTAGRRGTAPHRWRAWSPGRSRTPGCTAGWPSGRRRWSGSPSGWSNGRNTSGAGMAGEIHDGISQRIVSLFFHLSAAADAIPGSPEVAAEQVARAQELAGAALDETRSAIAGLRPPVLDDLGLAASLESLGHAFPTLDVRVDAAPLSMAEHAETAVYRTAQEALQNAAKHADARSIRVRLYRQKDRAVLEVTDDGTRLRPGRRPGGGRAGRAHRLRPVRDAGARGTARRPASSWPAPRAAAPPSAWPSPTCPPPSHPADVPDRQPGAGSPQRAGSAGIDQILQRGEDGQPDIFCVLS